MRLSAHVTGLLIPPMLKVSNEISEMQGQSVGVATPNSLFLPSL
jgi:hypothetical protein